MAAYRRVYDSRQLQLQVAKTAKNRDQLRNPTLGNRVWATFTFLQQLTFLSHPVCMDACMTGEAAAVRKRVLSVQDVGQRPPRDIRTLDQDPAVNNLPRVAATHHATLDHDLGGRTGCGQLAQGCRYHNTLDQDLSRTGGPPTSSLAPWQP